MFDDNYFWLAAAPGILALALVLWLGLRGNTGGIVITPVRITALALAFLMLVAFLASTYFTMDLLAKGIDALKEGGDVAEGIQQILLAVVAQQSLYVFLAALAAPLMKLCEPLPNEGNGGDHEPDPVPGQDQAQPGSQTEE